MSSYQTGQKIQIVLAAFLTTAASVNAIMGYSFAVFVPDLQKEFGWDRATASLAITVMSLGIFAAGATGGRLADRYGTMSVAIISALISGTTVLMFPWLISSVFAFCLCYFAIGVLGVGMLPITLLRPVGRLFTTRRGLATGIVLSGTGVSAIFIPTLASALIDRGGWRLGFVGFAVMIFATLPVLWFTLRTYAKTERRTVDNAETRTSNALPVGITLKEARRGPLLWVMTLISLLIGICFAGIVVHFILAYRDMGATRAYAATLMAIIGGSAIAGRLLTGFMMDRINGPVLGFFILLLSSAGFLLTRIFGLDGALFGAVLIGFGYGSEYDLIAYYVSRYFGMLEFGAIYGWLYGFIALGNAFGPLVVGVSYDFFGGYAPAMGAATVLTLIAALLTLSLGPFRYSVRAVNG